MAWCPAWAWTSQSPFSGYRHFELIMRGGCGPQRWVELAAELALSHRERAFWKTSRIEPTGAVAGTPSLIVMRLLQFAEPHLVGADHGLVLRRPALAHFERALQVGRAMNPDLVMVKGDLCQDKSWGGYVWLRRALSQHMRCKIALLPGNHNPRYCWMRCCVERAQQLPMICSYGVFGCCC